MKILNFMNCLRASAVIALLSASGFSVAQTAANTSITNLAELSFSVGGATLELESSATGNTTIGDGNGTSTDFLVDRLIDLLVAEVSGDVNSDDTPTASVGQNDVVLEYSITNQSNAPLGFDLHAEVNGAGIAPPAGFQIGTNPFTPSGVTIAVDGNGDDAFVAADDTAVVIDTLAAGASITVFVTADVDPTEVQDDFAFITLVAQAAEPGTGAATLITNDDNGNTSPGGTANDEADDPTAVQDVFADSTSDAEFNFTNDSGFATPGTVQNGQHSDTDVLLINGAQLSVQKEVQTIFDTVNANSNPKAIPGAFVRYTITIENAGGAAAALTNLTDTIPAQLVFDTVLLGTDCTVIANADPTDPAAGTGPDDTCSAGNGATVATSTDAVEVVFDSDIADGANATSSAFLTPGTAFSGQTLTVALSTLLDTDAGLNTGNTNDGDLNGNQSVTIIFNAILQ